MMTLLRLIGARLRPHWVGVVIVAVLQILQTLAMLLLPALNAAIIDDGVVRTDVGLILRLGAVMLALTLGQVLCTIAATFLSSRIAMSVGRATRSDVFSSVQRFSTREVGRFGAPSLITRATNDVQQVQMFVLFMFSTLVSAPIMGIGGVVLALQQDVALSGLLLALLPALVVVVLLVVRKLVPLFRRGQEQLDRVNTVLREQIMGLSVIRAFTREPEEFQRFDAANRDLTTVQRSTGYLLALLFPLIMLVVNIATVGIVYFGAHRIEAGQMEIGALQAFLAYILQILAAVMMTMFLFMMLPRASVSAERITEVLAVEPGIADEPGSANVQVSGALAFDSVDFRYPGAQNNVLTDIDFTARPGEVTAIIGSTGAGKTTLLNLVPRLLDATDGVVRVGGADVRDVPLSRLRSRIGLVPQRAWLASGTVRTNLQMAAVNDSSEEQSEAAADFTDDQLWEALRIAQAEDFVRAMSGGLDASIDAGGSNLSGGQRQRLCIARAVLRRPSIYLFDDSFSALDYTTDARLRAALGQWTADAVVVIVAQRVSTIRGADRILVLDEGRIVGSGSHEQLIETCPTYVEIVESQLSVEEAV